jgi:arylsulfatase A
MAGTHQGLRALCGLLVIVATLAGSLGRASDTPNIVVIYADDLGYGDVQCYNPDRGKIPTPHLDRLAGEGMRFTDAHSSSGVCSPSRYTLLTGRYHWRSRLQRGIVGTWEKPLIAADRVTIGTLAKEHGYRTACIGKWHLGWEWPLEPGDKALLGQNAKGKPRPGPADVTPAHRAEWKRIFSQPIEGGPTARGFDVYFGTDVPNWPPYCFIEQDRTVGIPTTLLPAEDFKNHRASTQGPSLEDWRLEAVLPALRDRAVGFIEQSAARPEPFLLYLPLTSPHTPLAVNEPWQGKSGLDNACADLIMETDAVVGDVLAAIVKVGIADDTLVIFTSDNGFAPYVGAKELEARGHYPSGPLRGYKSDAWEGGHRVPFIVRWPGTVKPESVCDALVHQSDVMATVADVLGATLPDTVGEDSVSLMPLLKGEAGSVREHAVSCSSKGVPAVRLGSWKYIAGPGSGGWGTGGDTSQPVQLYDLATDLGETKNLAATEPERVAEMHALLDTLITDGRSTPGPPQKNDVDVIRYPRQEATAKKTAQKSAATGAAAHPNILIILADDQGYGDVSANNPDCKIPTPNIDRLATEGMRFTDAHTSSGVCTPTRYSLLTGRYHWRTRLQSGVLGGFSKPLIAADRLTLAGLLGSHGYATACIGKWHLGMNWPLEDGTTADDGGNFGKPFRDISRVDYAAPIADGPVDRGFDHYYGISASLDMFPYVWINDRLPTEIATETKSFLTPARPGPAGKNFEAIDVQDGIVDHTIEWIASRAAAAKEGRPFFAYVPLAAPHTPIIPTPVWQGTSGINPYADFVKQVDAGVGKVLDALESHGLAENTIVVFTSDNGCSPSADIPQLIAAGHHPSFIYRGHKADLYEGGHRVPFLVRWPARIKAGSVCNQLVGQIDFLATFAELLGVSLPTDAGEDSVSMLPALLGTATSPIRTSLITQSMNGSFAIRDGQWKLCLCPGSGGWSPPRPQDDTSGLPAVQLYDLAADPGETTNLAEKHPDRVAAMTTMLKRDIDRGRTTPGPDQANDVPITMIKPSGRKATAAQ